jgi:hypothetical protein
MPQALWEGNRRNETNRRFVSGIFNIFLAPPASRPCSYPYLCSLS